MAKDPPLPGGGRGNLPHNWALSLKIPLIPLKWHFPCSALFRRKFPEKEERIVENPLTGAGASGREPIREKALRKEVVGQKENCRVSFFSLRSLVPPYDMPVGGERKTKIHL